MKIWKEEQRLHFLKVNKIVFIFAALAQIFHFFFIDLILNIPPLERWIYYRFGLAVAAILVVVCLSIEWIARGKYYQVPVLIVGSLFCFFQAQSMIWTPIVPYFFSILINVLTALTLRSSILLTLVYLGFLNIISLPGWGSRTDDFIGILSSVVVGNVAIIILRASLSTEVSLFITRQINIENQTKIIEQQIEINTHIRAFLPRKIYNQLINNVNVIGLSISDAMNEVLRPRLTLASCLYSDIRGFTKIVKRGHKYVLTSVLPSQRTFVEIVQNHSGIPRITGDLIFAIFENGDNAEKTIMESMTCALDVVNNQKLLNSNENIQADIRRHVIVSFGPALVGNTGGIDGSRDVAAYGDCANILSRIDEITKKENIRGLITPSSIILTEEAGELLYSLYPNLPRATIEFSQYNLELRDFSEQKKIYVLEASAVESHFKSAQAQMLVKKYVQDRYSQETISCSSSDLI